MVIPSGTLSQTLDLENFVTASRPRCQQNSSTVELVDDTYDGRRVVAVYCKSVNYNALIPLLRFLPDLLYNLFIYCSAAVTKISIDIECRSQVY